MNSMKLVLGLSGVGMLCLALCGCNSGNDSMQSPNEQAGTNPSMKAFANLEPTQGNNVKGTVTFTQEPNGVRVVAEITGLTPGKHGFHIHEKGDCSAPDGTSAGGHFNPTNMPHGSPDSEQHHVGDLGNITADATGTATMNQVFGFLELTGTNSIVGRGVIVHSGEDDFTTQPTGNAGSRVACGVIMMMGQ